MIPSPPPLPRRITFTRGSRVSSKEKISKDKNNSSSQGTQHTSSSPISGQASTSRDPGLRPYWNDHARDLSRRLWLPNEIDSAGSPSNSFRTSSRFTVRGSWFSSTSQTPTNTSSPRIYLPSIPSSSAGCKDEKP